MRKRKAGGHPSPIPNHTLAVQIKSCIRGRAVDVPTAHKCFRKFAELACLRAKLEVTERSPNHYDLNELFFRLFGKHLRELTRSQPPAEMNGADLIARAVYRAAWLWGRKPQKVLISPDQLWIRGAPISRAWEKLGQLSADAVNTSIVLEDAGAKLRLPRPNQFEFPRIKLSLSCSNDRQSLPMLTIQIEGEPVCVLIKAMYELRDPKRRRTVRKDAERIWESLMPYMTRIRHPKGGRLREVHLREAAYLRDFHGWSWRRIGDHFCFNKGHSHSFESACVRRLLSPDFLYELSAATF